MFQSVVMFSRQGSMAVGHGRGEAAYCMGERKRREHEGKRQSKAPEFCSGCVLRALVYCEKLHISDMLRGRPTNAYFCSLNMLCLL